MLGPGSFPLQSYVKVETGNGYGSTNTHIRRWTTNTVVGSDITYADSATLGGSFTINVAGIYSIYRNDNHAGANLDVGISLNSSQLTTNVSVITAADRLAIWEMPTTGSANSQGGCGLTRYFNAGDVIRGHDNLASTAVNVYSWMYVTRVS